MTENHLDGYYCSEKFTWLTVDLEKRQMSSCCAAQPSAIDIQWIKSNPGQIFNNPFLLQERTDMLSGVPVKSCESVCWNPEKNNQISRRMLFSTQAQKFNQTQIDKLKDLHVLLGSTCNMTCVYCCKQYSSAWLNDIKNQGSYFDDERFQLNQLDQILVRLSQPERNNSLGSTVLLKELTNLDVTDRIFITGGEPFLYNNLNDVVNSFNHAKKIVIYTGLGVNTERFQKQLEKITMSDRIELAISVENTNKNYEFARYGNTWERFIANLNVIEKYNIDWSISSVLSNITIFGFQDFFSTFSTKNIKYEFCSDPKFLNVNVMDDHSKDQLIKQLNSSDIPFRDSIIQNMMAPVTDDMRIMCSKYILEFAKRRNLKLDIFPKSFQSWIQYESR